ncbi:MAG: hypothetical protein MJ201_02665 [Mycoplasmoidaceae bacterium]|nr:hypothetical protein [Mycoplasmoidaceae bacterium]
MAIPIIINDPIVSIAKPTPVDQVTANTIAKIINTNKKINIEIAVAPIIFPIVKALLRLITLEISKAIIKIAPVMANMTGSHHKPIN